MRKYELILTFDPDLNEEGVAGQLEKLRSTVASFDGKVLHEENSGRQPLAYPIKKKNYGTYVLLIVEVKPEFVNEFNRAMRINDQVLRFMAVLRDEQTGESIKRAEERPRTRERTERFPRGGRDRFRGDGADDDADEVELEEGAIA